MQKSDFCFPFMSMPPAPPDWANLARSRCATVMIPWRWGGGAETLGVLRELRRQGRRAVLRMNAEDMAQPPATLLAQGTEYRAACPLAGIILGPNEPDSPYDATWASADWGQAAAWDLQSRLNALQGVLRRLQTPLISPALIQRPSNEGAPAVPGQVAWADILRPVTNGFDGNGVHLYEDAWISPVDEARFRRQVAWWAAHWHKTLWIDELGINTGTQVERMRAYIAMAKILLTDANGARVNFLCPFLSTGTGIGYNPAYLLNDPQAYAELGAFLA